MNNDFLSDFGDMSSGLGDSDSKDNQKLQKISGGELEKFAKSVLGELVNDNVPPIPENYKIYFEKHLDDKTMTFKKRILEMMEFENTQDNKQIFIENKVKKSFNSLNHLLQDIAMVYKNTEVIREVLEKKAAELSINSGNLNMLNVIESLQNDMKRYTSLLEKYSMHIKENFEYVNHTYKSIEEQSDFDPVYSIYNFKFLSKILTRCAEGYAKYNYQNSLLLFRVKKSVLDSVSPKDQVILLKNISKILQKNVVKGDIVACYKDGIFAVLLQHTNIQKAQSVAQTLIDNIYNTNFFMSSNEVNIDIQVALTLVKDDTSVDKTLEKVAKALDSSGKDKDPFSVVE
ncbi:hypothetical protein DMB92_06495 [Campylobacter sp. MIT 99-7217]|uniref:GGDEF domain-containing protein n=1 Tax=Campylobacter sp. MIT 99-7217 TaxID=535091 RepID=UPI00115C1023|nr:GGDEF domain-containing protein [Campylobacter sp. MIT 99-7217]TQR31334.1 hypothetical protein DMB92_06495 [Campylobacter sp. MIT 99-7217]